MAVCQPRTLPTQQAVNHGKRENVTEIANETRSRVKRKMLFRTDGTENKKSGVVHPFPREFVQRHSYTKTKTNVPSSILSKHSPTEGG